MLYTDYIIVKPDDILSVLNKVKDQELIRLEFSFNFLRVIGENIRISVKAISGVIKPKLIFTISREDCQKLVNFYEKHILSGAFIDLKENGRIIFHGWNEETRKDDKITIFDAKAVAKLKVA
jgi:hypothetical protein